MLIQDALSLAEHIRKIYMLLTNTRTVFHHTDEGTHSNADLSKIGMYGTLLHRKDDIKRLRK